MISLVKRKLDDEIDELFRLPVAEFTGARNALAVRLKKEGRPNDAERVKLLAKPSVSAWAVNQLYWDHRDAFDQLIATGKRFSHGPTSRRTGKAADMRESLDARRDALVQLSELATELLRDAGHNPSQDTVRRVTATLEALSAYALLPDGPTPGRLTNDVDPPSFESLASLMSSGGSIAAAPAKSKSTQKAAIIADVRKIQQAKIAAAKASLQDAKRSLTEARAKAQSLEATQKKANAEAKESEKQRREAEKSLEKATAASKDAARRAQAVAAEAQQAAQAFEDAKRTLEETTKELESLLRQ
jgi:DNA repair exonuclease SbcCD ATPase subunit